MRGRRAFHAALDVAHVLGCLLLIYPFATISWAGGWVGFGLAVAGFLLLLIWSLLLLVSTTSPKHAVQGGIAVTLMFVGSLWIGRGAPDAPWLPSPGVGALWIAGCAFVLVVMAVIGLRAGGPRRSAAGPAPQSEQQVLGHLRAMGTLNLVAGCVNILSGLAFGVLMFCAYTFWEDPVGPAPPWASMLAYAPFAAATALGCIQLAAGRRILARRRRAVALAAISAALGWTSVLAFCLWPLLVAISIYTGALLSRKAVRRALTCAQDEGRAAGPGGNPATGANGPAEGP
jgi:hypothetical protein